MVSLDSKCLYLLSHMANLVAVVLRLGLILYPRLALRIVAILLPQHPECWNYRCVLLPQFLRVFLLCSLLFPKGPRLSDLLHLAVHLAVSQSMAEDGGIQLLPSEQSP